MCHLVVLYPSLQVQKGLCLMQKGTYLAGDGSEFVKWCGLLINTATLELQADYTRYAGLPLSTTLTVPFSKVQSAVLSLCPGIFLTVCGATPVLCLLHCAYRLCSPCLAATATPDWRLWAPMSSVSDQVVIHARSATSSAHDWDSML